MDEYWPHVAPLSSFRICDAVACIFLGDLEFTKREKMDNLNITTKLVSMSYLGNLFSKNIKLKKNVIKKTNKKASNLLRIIKIAFCF